MTGRGPVAAALAVVAALSGCAPATPDLRYEIPFAMHGRWGITAEDCIGGAGATSLIEIDAFTIKLADGSTETVGKVHQIDLKRLDADFAFTGVGGDRVRRETIQLLDPASTMLRSIDGAPPIEYTLCP